MRQPADTYRLPNHRCGTCGLSTSGAHPQTLGAYHPYCLRTERGQLLIQSSTAQPLGESMRFRHRARLAREAVVV